MTINTPASRSTLALAVAMVTAVALIAGGMGVYVASDPSMRQAYTLSYAAAIIDRHYPEELDWDRVAKSARDEMINTLDRFSGYVPQRQFQEIDQGLTGGYYGIGVSVIEHESGLMIMSVREGGPAAKAGLLTGDIIVKADSVALSALDAQGASHLLRGEEGTTVDLVLLRLVSDDSLKISVTRRRIEFLHIPFAGFTPDSVLYIRLLDFDAGAAADLESALDSLLAPNQSGAKGIVLDLRGNPGGLFVEARKVADLFLEKGDFIVGASGRSRWNDQEFYAQGEDKSKGLPLAIIVDGGSASSSEIVAGSLQQSGRATLVGDTTFGKGLVQGFVRFPDGDGLRLTVSRYYIGDGVYLNEFDTALNEFGAGLAPDKQYSYFDRSSFHQALERSLALQRFAHQYQEQIVGLAAEGGLGQEWMSKFEQYAVENGFEYISDLTRTARDLLEAASSEVVRDRMSRIIQMSERADRNQMFANRVYIEMRLKRIAIERKHGVYRAYKEVEVHERPIIRLAADIVTGEEQ